MHNVQLLDDAPHCSLTRRSPQLLVNSVLSDGVDETRCIMEIGACREKLLQCHTLTRLAAHMGCPLPPPPFLKVMIVLPRQ